MNITKTLEKLQAVSIKKLFLVMVLPLLIGVILLKLGAGGWSFLVSFSLVYLMEYIWERIEKGEIQ